MSTETSAPQLRPHFTPEPHRWIRPFGAPLPYCRSLKNAACLEALQRPIPVRVNGTLLICQTDFERGKFTCSWKEDPAVTSPTRIYLPKRIFTGRRAVRLRPLGAGFTVEPVAGNEGHVHLVVAPTGAASERTLTVN